MDVQSDNSGPGYEPTGVKLQYSDDKGNSNNQKLIMGTQVQLFWKNGTITPLFKRTLGL
jgi:hypothetical protein